MVKPIINITEYAYDALIKEANKRKVNLSKLIEQLAANLEKKDK